MGWLIAYDIANVRRWRRLHRLLKGTGAKLQYSLFWADLDARAARALGERIAKLIDDEADDVRLYNLPDAAPVDLLGPRLWPVGIMDAAAHRFCVPAMRYGDDLNLYRQNIFSMT